MGIIQNERLTYLYMRLLTITITFMCIFIKADAYAYAYNFKTIDRSFDGIARQLNQKDFDNERENISPSLLDRLDRIAAASDERQLKARAIYWRIRASQMSAMPSQCISQLEKAKALCSDKYDYDLACINYQLAGNYERMGQYLKTYSLLNDALPVFNKYNDYYFLGNAYLLMAQMFYDINDPENSIDVLRRAEQNYARAHYPLNRIYFFKAILSDAGGNAQLALYKKSLATGGSKDWGMTLQALTNISTCFLSRQMPDSALAYCNRGFMMLNSKNPGNPLFETLLFINKAQILYQQHNYGEALRILHRLERRGDELRGERFMADVYKYLWLTNEKTGNMQAAYGYLKLYQQEYERNNSEISKQDVPKARARETIARRNDTIRLLEKDAELSRNYLFLVISASVIIALIVVALLIYFYQRYRIRRIENRELRSSLQHEALIYAVNRKNFEEDIKQKDCEISSSTLLLANKNEVLQQISGITKKYSEEGKIPQEYVKQVNDVIGDSLKNDDEWQRFKLHFDSVHPDFFVKLKATSSELTENDLRLCAYINIGMRAKQIAEMLSVSPDSVNSNRYRLRKKLHLEKGQSLDDFIRKI